MKVAFSSSSAMDKTIAIVVVGMVQCLACWSQVPGQDPAPPPSAYEHCRNLHVSNAPSGTLVDICDFALSTEKQYPNFICEEKTERFEPVAKESYKSFEKSIRPTSVITATVRFADGVESYTNVTVDGAPAATDLLHVGGMSSTGEFVTALRNIFAAESKTTFASAGETVVNSKPVLVFTFQVPGEKSQWVIQAGPHLVTPAYHGRVLVGKAASQLIGMEQEAELDRGFPYAQAIEVTEYAPVDFGDRGVFIMPSRSVMTACTTPHPESCSRNETRFENCRRFTATARVVPNVE